MSSQTADWLLSPPTPDETGWPSWAYGVPRLLAACVLARRGRDFLEPGPRGKLGPKHFGWFSFVISLELRDVLGGEIVDRHLKAMEESRLSFVPKWFPFGTVSYALWLWREDLRPVSPGNLRCFIGWWITGGAREYRIEVGAAVRQYIERPARDRKLAALGFTEQMACIWRWREDLHFSCSPSTAAGQRGFIGWWLTRGAREQGVEVGVALRQYIERPVRDRELAALGFTEQMACVWQWRDDLHFSCSPSTAAGQRGFIGWWLSAGAEESGGDAAAELIRYQQIPAERDAEPFGVSLAMLGLAIFVHWGYGHGFAPGADGYRMLFGRWLRDRRSPDGSVSLAIWQRIRAAHPDPQGSAAYPLPLLVTALAAADGRVAELKSALRGDVPAARRLMAYAALSGEYGELAHAVRTAFAEQLRAPAPDVPAHMPVTELMMIRRLHDEALQSLPPIESQAGLRALAGWAIRHEWLGQNDVPAWCLPLLERPCAEDFDIPFGLVALAAYERGVGEGPVFSDRGAAAAWLLGLQSREPGRFQWLRFPVTALRAGLPPWEGYELGGVQLLGWAKGELGIGEDVRMGVLAMTAAGIPHVPINVGGKLATREEDTTLDAVLGSRPRYAASITFLAAADHYRQLIGAARGLRDGRYRIGNWVWELPNWPPRLDFAFDAVDEVWAPSRYIQNAFSGRSKPVLYMPYAVEIDAPPAMPRKQIGLRDDSFVFLTTFDVNSSISRKNPDGVIKAFRRAFPQRLKDACLIVKTMNAKNDPETWQKVTELAGGDKRIRFLDRTLTRPDMLALLRAVDCFVSLHRAEGFGRNIAEAMLLAKPVVSSAYSGNVDFTLPDNAYLVEGRLRPLKPREYTYWLDQEWLEPDLDQAASQMRRVYENRAEAAARGATARATIREMYGAASVGARYRARLSELGFI